MGKMNTIMGFRTWVQMKVLNNTKKLNLCEHYTPYGKSIVNWLDYIMSKVISRVNRHVLKLNPCSCS